MGAAVQVRSDDRQAFLVEPEPDTPRLDGRQRDLIGERLKQMYAALQEEPLPPRLREVLERLAGIDSE
jgi:hypothetical protein